MGDIRFRSMTLDTVGETWLTGVIVTFGGALAMGIGCDRPSSASSSAVGTESILELQHVFRDASLDRMATYRFITSFKSSLGCIF